MNRNRIHIYLGDDAHRVKQNAKRRGVSISKLAHVAILAFIDADEDKREALFFRRFDRLSRQLGKLEQDLSVMSETLALFIQYELLVKPPLPILDQESAQMQGKARFEQFIKRVADRISSGRTLVNQVIEEVVVSEGDFYQMDLEVDGDENEQK